jgi:membrane protein required for colicin V production
VKAAGNETTSDVTKFDIIVLGLLALSGVVGFVRGAMREVAALVALVVAALVTIFGASIWAPAAQRIIHHGWLGSVAGLILVFGGVYLALRLIGAVVAQRVQAAHVLGVLDRTCGLLIGLVRGLVVLGALFLMFNAATPKDIQPSWITGATTWPLASNMGRLLTALAPKGFDLAGRLKPAFSRAVDDASRDRTTTEGYEARSRREIDSLVEQSR